MVSLRQRTNYSSSIAQEENEAKMQRKCDAMIELKLKEMQGLNKELADKIYENNSQREQIKQLEERIKLMGGENQLW